MHNIIRQLLDWSEVWAFLIPVPFMLIHKKHAGYLKPVRIYIWIAIVLTLAINIIWKFKEDFGLQKGDFWWSNNFLYNIHSIFRFVLFSWFFILLKQPFLQQIKRIISLLFIVFVLVNFILLEDFFYYNSFSSRLLSVETAILLLLCLQYYFFILREDMSAERRPPSFWVVTGLSVYAVINFPIFLFYSAFYKEFENFAIQIWDVTNLSLVIFCIFLARAFYISKH